MKDRVYTIPGVYFETPRSRELRLKGVPVGVTGFIGYCRRKVGRAGTTSGPLWPIMIESAEQIHELIEVPYWSNMVYALYGFFANGGHKCFVVGISEEEVHSQVNLLGGGEPGHRYGLAALDAAEEVELIAAPDLYLVPPGLPDPELNEVLVNIYTILDFCKGFTEQDRVSQGGYFAILDAPPELSEEAVVEFARILRNHPNADHAALFYPWIDVMRGDGLLHRIPPSGQLSGILSGASKPGEGELPGSVGFNNGPHLSAGNKVVADAISAEIALRRTSLQTQMEANVNCLVSWPTRGIVVWGTRTLSPQKELNQISVRRVLSYIERSIYVGTQWAVFEPNDMSLWKRMTSTIEIFLDDLWKKGILVGDSPEEAFIVQCDEENNPPSEQDEGRLNIMVLVKPVRSTEYIVIQITHETAGGGGE